MSTYYSPEKVRKHGRRIGRHDNVSHRKVVISSNGLFERASDVTKQSEYDMFYEQYRKGMWLTWELYDYNPVHEE